MLKWISEESRLLPIAIIFATLVGACMFRYEPYSNGGRLQMHPNRIRGAVCLTFEECWLSSHLYLEDRIVPPSAADKTTMRGPATKSWG
jgi:hypothetical protein